MPDSVYTRLAKRLDGLFIAYPATESGVELRILERWFTPEEAEIAATMNGYPEPIPAIAERLGRSSEALAPVLETMSKKGLLFRIAKGQERFYNIVPLAEGMWEFHLNTNTPEDAKDLNKYFQEYMVKGWYGAKTSQHRVIPISRSIDARMDIMPYDQAETIIRQQKKIAVAHCICRRDRKLLGKGCDHPSEVCMAFGTGAYYYIENGLGREISREEALQILQMAMEAGLALQPGNGQKVWSMCMCCGCGCGLLRTLQKMKNPAEFAHTNFYAEVHADDCTACGLCEKRCPMQAIIVQDDMAAVNRDRCIGCGVCVGACAFNAAKLVLKSEQDRYVPPLDVLDMQKRIALERKSGSEM
jgi:NAD-dependent dihydropyrimidine dehydrogenase PreA subunit